jgi:FkbM family methyltransferase
VRFLVQKLNGLKKRLTCFSYGIAYLKERDFVIPSVLKINGKKKQIRFINAADRGFVYEFTETCLNDCYRLAALKKQLGTVNTIIDIGANQGLFTIAARQHFNKAAIVCYEPNRQLENILNYNAAAVQASVFYEAATKEDCTVTLNFTASDMHTTAHPAAEGTVPGTAFKKILARAGGKIDILKMDCEGGEWAILEDGASWANIRSVTMEYHLWAKPGSTVTEIKQILNNLGFHIISHNPLNKEFGLLAAVK